MTTQATPYELGRIQAVDTVNHGQPLPQPELTVLLRLPADAPRFGKTYQAQEAAIFARLARAKEDYLSNDPWEDRRELQARLRQVRQERQQTEHTLRSARSKAKAAIAAGQDAGKHERAAVEAQEHLTALAEVEAELPKEIDEERYGVLFEMQGAIMGAAEAIRAEVQARLEAALAALPDNLGELLREVWLARELAWLMKPRVGQQTNLAPDPLAAEMGRLGRALPSGFDGRVSAPPPDETGTLRDRARYPSGGPSIADIREAMGPRIYDPPEPETLASVRPR